MPYNQVPFHGDNGRSYYHSLLIPPPPVEDAVLPRQQREARIANRLDVSLYATLGCLGAVTLYDVATPQTDIWTMPLLSLSAVGAATALCLVKGRRPKIPTQPGQPLCMPKPSPRVIPDEERRHVQHNQDMLYQALYRMSVQNKQPQALAPFTTPDGAHIITAMHRPAGDSDSRVWSIWSKGREKILQGEVVT